MKGIKEKILLRIDMLVLPIKNKLVNIKVLFSATPVEQEGEVFSDILW